MIFETKRLYVVQWKEGDLKTLYELFSDIAINELIGPALTIEETTHIFEQQISDYELSFPFGRYFIVEKSSKKFIGLFLLKQNQNESAVEIGYSLKKADWNKGYATEIAKRSVSWLFSQEKFSNIYAVTETENINSQRVLLKCGFMQKKNFFQDNKEMSLFALEK